MAATKPKTGLTAAQVRAALDYDPETGVLTWRARPGTDRITRAWNTRFSGTVAGYIARYRVIMINKRKHMAHRLAWVHFYGRWPDAFLDHINCDKRDNRIANLREATQAQNHMNRGPLCRNKSGYKGVSWNKIKKKWVAQIVANGKHSRLGFFRDPKEAHEAYVRAARELHGEFARAE